MEQSKFKKLLNRYLKSNANETETALVDAWYKSYQSAEEEVKVDEKEKSEIKKNLLAKINKEHTPKKIIPIYYRIAAAIAIVAATVAVFYQSKDRTTSVITYQTVAAKAKQVKKVVLPDSSVVWLNAASSLRVPSHFAENVREVYLDEGEAFFEVTKNPEKPFIIHQNSFKVQVLGTSFNVRAYKKLSDIKVTVSTGKVQVSNAKKSLAVLTPQQEISFNKKTENYQVNPSVNDAEKSGWRDGEIHLKQASFKEICLVLKNSFNIHLKSQSSDINQYHFTVNIHTNMSVTEVLNLISAIHNSAYRKEGDVFVIY